MKRICYNTSCSAGVAHPVERHLAKVEVASSSLVTRSIIRKQMRMHLLSYYGNGGRGSKNSYATVRWTVAATSANTGGYIYFCQRQKCKRASSPASGKRASSPAGGKRASLPLGIASPNLDRIRLQCAVAFQEPNDPAKLFGFCRVDFLPAAVCSLQKPVSFLAVCLLVTV